MTTPTDQPPSPPKPRRGAPHGNKNALKHGFYSRSFGKIDHADLNTAAPNGLSDEITMLRVFIRRLTERYQPSDDAHATLAMVRTLSAASISLARLVHLQHKMEPSESDIIARAAMQALTDMEKEGFFEPHDPQPPAQSSFFPPLTPGGIKDGQEKN